jgi:hypothetical protein
MRWGSKIGRGSVREPCRSPIDVVSLCGAALPGRHFRDWAGAANRSKSPTSYYSFGVRLAQNDWRGLRPHWLGRPSSRPPPQAASSCESRSVRYRSSVFGTYSPGYRPLRNAIPFLIAGDSGKAHGARMDPAHSDRPCFRTCYEPMTLESSTGHAVS